MKYEEEYKKLNSAKLSRNHLHNNVAQKAVMEMFDR